MQKNTSGVLSAARISIGQNKQNIFFKSIYLSKLKFVSMRVMPQAAKMAHYQK